MPLNSCVPNRKHHGSSGISTSETWTFVETLEYRRFVEFANACRQDRYIGLCFGPPGIGKTISAHQYSRAGMVVAVDPWTSDSSDGLALDTVFYTPPVVNSAGRIESDLRRAREILTSIATRSSRTEARSRLAAIRTRDDEWRREHRNDADYRSDQVPPLEPTYVAAFEGYEAKTRSVLDPTTLVVIDEADRLRMLSLEQLRSIFDEGGIGMVLIGMPGIEKRIARFPQFYSRIGFVHEFRPLGATEMRAMLAAHWTPEGVSLPEPFSAEAIAAMIRMTGGNFRLLRRLMTQLERVVTINHLEEVSVLSVETARENLVIGHA